MNNKDEAYHADFDHVSKTMLNTFLSSPVIYQKTFVTREMKPKRPSAQMEIGTAVHSILLDRADISDVLALVPSCCLKSNGAINPKPFAEMREANPGTIFVKADEFRRIESIVQAVRDSEIGALVDAATDRERAIYWTDAASGLKCRAKPDWVCELETVVYVYDLKVCEQIDEFAWTRSAKRLRYWLQDAHYSSGLAKLTGKPVQFRFAVVESVYPYRTWLYEYCRNTREEAAARHARSLCKLSAAYSANEWKDDWSHTITLNEWDFSQRLELDDVEIREGEVSSVDAF